MGRACLPSEGLSTKSCVLTATSWQTRSAPSLQPPGNTTLIVSQVCKATSAIRVEDVCKMHWTPLCPFNGQSIHYEGTQKSRKQDQVSTMSFLFASFVYKEWVI